MHNSFLEEAYDNYNVREGLVSGEVQVSCVCYGKN